MRTVSGGRPGASGLVCDRPLEAEIDSACCRMPPSPELLERMARLNDLAGALPRGANPSALEMLLREPVAPGLNDGTVRPGPELSPGTFARVQPERKPLKGKLQVLVVLVDFPGTKWLAPARRFEDLFFSTGKIATGSVHEYYTEVSGGLVGIAGQVVGPFTLPHPMTYYSNGNAGMGGAPNAQDMALDAFNACRGSVSFATYDNDGDGFVDAFVIVHAGQGAESTGNATDIWSHKWTMRSPQTANGKQIYAYLTIPEDAKLGVCAHELGHLLFGWPDLYDTTGASSGLGNFCLMAGGSWGGGGNTPVHPSAWCKAHQSWITVRNHAGAAKVSLPDVKIKKEALRLWTGSAVGPEYFLAENRQGSGFDKSLAGPGLLVYHVDENQSGNTIPTHYKVGLVQADGLHELEKGVNRGDAADPYPGTSGKIDLDPASRPDTDDYAGAPTKVALRNIKSAGGIITFDASV